MEVSRNTRWQDWVNLFLGLWLFFAPFFGVGIMVSEAAYSGYVFGIIIAVLSVIALFRPRGVWEEWINLVIGLWLIVAPFALVGFMGPLMWNSVIVGLLVSGVAVLAMATRPVDPTHHIPHHA